MHHYERNKMSAYRVWAAAMFLVLTMAATMPGNAQVQIDGELLNDPTRPINATKQAISQKMEAVRKVEAKVYAVGFVRVSSKSSIAIVNGVPVGVGDEVDGATVLAITANGVMLNVDGKERLVAPYGSIVSSFESYDN